MASTTPHVCIVVLNWNGWRDTIECLQSISMLDYSSVCTIVIDNNSSDESLVKLMAWAKTISITRSEGTEGPHVEVVPYHPNSGRIDNLATFLRPAATLLVKSDENLGFAAGCNLGIRLAIKAGIDYVWLLNNDTVAVPDSLRKLVELLDQHPDLAGATGQIRYQGKPEIVWNCGGKLLPLGLRRYSFRNAPASTVPASGHRRISFMTGCAALLRTSTLCRLGLLSEDFFFGEEDFELCQRLKRRGQKLACRYDAVIYHKVGSSISKVSPKGLPSNVYLYHLNRFVHMRRYWHELIWNIWRLAYCPYLLFLLMNVYGVPFRRSIGFLWRLLVESHQLHRVDRFAFQAVMGATRASQPKNEELLPE